MVPKDIVGKPRPDLASGGKIETSCRAPAEGRASIESFEMFRSSTHLSSATRRCARESSRSCSWRPSSGYRIHKPRHKAPAKEERDGPLSRNQHSLQELDDLCPERRRQEGPPRCSRDQRPALIGYLGQIPGQLHVCLEESEWSGWLYEILEPHVAEVVVEHARWRAGSKTDAIDARDLAHRLRTGQIEIEVYKTHGAAPNSARSHGPTRC